MRTAIQIFLGIAIIILGFMVWESIMAPIRFNKERIVREIAVISRLKDIRESQRAYRDLKNHFTDNFDSLIHFVKNDSFTLTRAIGVIPEELIDETRDIRRAREIALERGIIRRERTKVSVLDSLFGKNYPVDSLRYVPYSNKAEFKIVTDEFTSAANITIRVIEVSALYDVFLQGLDPQLSVNYAEERRIITNFPGLKFGSLVEGTLTGNWE